VLITQGFAFAALARASDGWTPVYAPYAVAEEAARTNRRGLWSGSFTHPAAILQRGGQ
jgi:endonuclease YncB( thermonuclease family)